MKGIILAGGAGTRLYPMTKTVSKQLLPIYDKPMVYYPLSVLMMAGIRDILIISTPRDTPNYRELLKDGSALGLHISCVVQNEPKGLAEAFILGEEFIAGDSVCLILGDNIFYSQGLSSVLSAAVEHIENGKSKALVFGYPVNDARDFGVVEFDEDMRVISLEEKPENPKSHYAVPGLYFYNDSVIDIAKTIVPSSRNELEITEVNKAYLERGELSVQLLGRGMAWLDTGTPEGLLKASGFVEAIQSRQGFYISCIEEIAWRMGYIDAAQLEALGREFAQTQYGQYLMALADSAESPNPARLL